MKFETSTDKLNVCRKYYQTVTSNGMMVELSTFGAAIQNIALRFENGWRSVVLSYPGEKALINSGSYAGRTLAPNAGRIRGGALKIADRNLLLVSNDGPNQLHGGKHNLSFIDWDVEEIKETLDYVKVTFSAAQADGLDGFPGNRCYYVTYLIEDTNWIRIEYRAASDRETYVNLSNHTYWNMAGTDSMPDVGNGLRQELEITANNVILNDSESLPADIIPVSGTAFDFRVPVSLQHMLDSELLRSQSSAEQFLRGHGYNNAYILTRADLRRHLRGVRHEEALKKACTLRDPVSGHQMTMMTNANALVLYSGGFLPVPGSHIALEAQDIPDIGNLFPERMVLTTPDKPFYREIRLKLS